MYFFMIDLHFLVLFSCYAIDMISISETKVIWLQGWDKHTTVSALENRIKDLRR